MTANLQTIALCSVRLLPAQRSIFHIVKAEHEGGKKLTLNSTQSKGPRNAFLPYKYQVRPTIGQDLLDFLLAKKVHLGGSRAEQQANLFPRRIICFSEGLSTIFYSGHKTERWPDSSNRICLAIIALQTH